MDSDGRVAFSRIELILIILFVLLAMGIFVLVSGAVSYFQPDETLQILRYENAAGVPQAEADAAVLSTEQNALQEALVARKAAQTQGVISLTVIAAAPAAVETRTILEAEQTAVAQEIPLLETELNNAVEAVNVAQAELARKRQQATRNRQLSNAALQGAVLVLAGMITAVVMGGAAVLVRSRGVYESWAISEREVFGATAALLALLFGYAAFDIIGAACGAVLVLIALAIWVARRGRGT